MTEENEITPQEQLEQIISNENGQELVQYIDENTVSEVVRTLSRLSQDDQQQFLNLLDAKDAADLVEQLPDAMAVDMIRELSPTDAAKILDELPSNDRADLLAEFDEDEAEAIFKEMESESASDARFLTEYPGDVAGGLMITEYVWHYESATVDDVVRDFRNNADVYSDYDIQYAYIVSEMGILTGVLRLRDLIMAPVKRAISDIMIKNPLKVRDMESLQKLGDFFDDNNFLGVPVVDDSGRLIGVVRREDVDEALLDQTGSDYLKSQGIVGGEELRTMPIWRRSYRRLSWLTVNIGLNVIAASVIAAYQDTLSAVIALAVFLPIISDMSGCSGNQAVAVSIRELSLGLVKPLEVFHVWVKESSVGIINGLVLGLLLGFAAWLWKGNLYLSLVIAAAMGINTLIAVSIGGVVPLLLKWMKFDPALASGPILTTVTDMCGFFLLLSMATMMISKL